MGIWVGSRFFFLHCYDKIPWLKATYERICFDLLFGMGHPLPDQDSAVGSRYRKLVNHNVSHRKQGEWEREGDRETERDREGGMERRQKLSKPINSQSLLYFPTPQWCTSSSKLQFLKAWWLLQALPPAEDQVLSQPLGDISYSNLHRREESRIKDKLCNGTFLNHRKVSVSVLLTKGKYALDLKKKKSYWLAQLKSVHCVNYSLYSSKTY